MSASPVQAAMPLRARLARWVLARLGWRVIYAPPPGPRSVVIVYPHTSNWDFIVGVLARAALQFPVRWLGKDALFRPPMGTLMRWLGGIAVDRSAPHGLIEQLRARFAAADTLHLVITPEGTRSHVPHWKSGFYALALAARVPVGLGFIDFGARRVGIDTWLDLTGDEAADLARIRAFYADKRGCRPELAGEIRFAHGNGERVS